jgi:hypothetical protein
MQYWSSLSKRRPIPTASRRTTSSSTTSKVDTHPQTRMSSTMKQAALSSKPLQKMDANIN